MSTMSFSDSDEFDELDELIGLIDEDDVTQEKKEKEKVIATKQKSQDLSDEYVCASIRCKLRVDPKTRAISSESLHLRLRHWTFVSLTNLPLKLNNRCVSNKEFVVIGILAEKTISMSKKNNKYLRLKIDDFNATISCFVFNAEIISKFYKINEGTVLVLAGPEIMSDNRQNSNPNPNQNKFGNFGNQSNSGNNISLKINKNDQVLVVGKSIDFGFCNTLLENGRDNKCKAVVNKSKFDLCPFHKQKQYKRFALRRSDSSRGTISMRTKNNKKSLSGSMSGVSMIRRGKMPNGLYESKNRKKQRRKSCALTNEDKLKTANLLLESTGMTTFMEKRMKRYSNGGKKLLQIQKNEKKKKLSKILKGKVLLPQLGTKWGNGSNKMGGMGFVLTPMQCQKEDTSEAALKAKESKKRTFAEMEKESMESMDCDWGKAESVVGPKMKRMRLRHETKETEKDNNSFFDTMDCEEEKFDENMVNFVKVTLYVCKFKKCSMKDKISEKANGFCKRHAQNVVKSVGKKYFWKCSHCKTKSWTLNKTRLIPKCRKCGGKDFNPTYPYDVNVSKQKEKEQKIKEQKSLLVNNTNIKK